MSFEPATLVTSAALHHADQRIFEVAVQRIDAIAWSHRGNLLAVEEPLSSAHAGHSSV